MVFSKSIHKRRKFVAAMFLLLMTAETCIPTFSYALTSGPSQPEMKGFEAVGTANLVDPFTGDFSYNIPLLDVDGYPVSISYQAGASPDDEGSWVGYGWSLTPGSMNRQMRGLPDDFNGSDRVEKQMKMKDNITKSLTTTVSVDALGIPGRSHKKAPKDDRIKSALLSPNISLSINYDNYRGIGTTLGINTGLAIGEMVSSALNFNNKQVTADPPSTGNSNNSSLPNLSLSLSASSMDGASAGVSFPILKKQINGSDVNFTSTIGFPYSSRAGLQGMSFSNSFNTAVIYKEDRRNVKLTESNSFISFADPTHTPTIDIPLTQNSFSASISPGVQLAPIFLGFGFSGSWAKSYISAKDQTRSYNAYGLMYADKARTDANALMDFNREKDIPYSNEIQYLPIPVPTNDLFSASGQNMGGQYKIHRGSHGVFFDPTEETNKGTNGSIGIEAGGGLFWDAGLNLFLQNTSNKSGKWIKNNNFLEEGDFQVRSSAGLTYENAYFKKIGEPVAADLSYYQQLGGDSTVSVAFVNNSGASPATNKALRNSYGVTNISSGTKLGRNNRAVRNEPVIYLTAEEAVLHGLDKKIKSYPLNQLSVDHCDTNTITKISRVSSYRKKHHLSEMTVTGKDGSRNVYGIPVYNTYQEDLTFSITGDTSKRRNGLIDYTDPMSDAAGSFTREKLYNKQTLPAYATSYLLTAVLSPDYVDVKGDGVTDDDQGNAVKFNYHKLSAEYQWRTPFGAGKANYNEGMLSDRLDDKASYSYGKRESWYLHSIESKTMVALFITENRDDALGVSTATGTVNSSSRLKRLKEIRLFSKADVYANNGDLEKLTPIKVVHFEYSYSLLPGIPNTIGSSTGKLTLKKIYFTYGNSTLGKVHNYSFEYNMDSIPLTNFHHKQYDRWGTYKDQLNNPSGLLNSEYPYTSQDTALSNAYVAAWQLKKINLPTGGSISVQYEADDYAYVQNKRAMIMLPIKGIGTVGASGGLIGANELIVDIPYPINSVKEFLYHYLNGEPYVYFKSYTNLDNKGHYEFVPGYAKFESVRLLSSTRVAITLKKDNVEGTGLVHPIAHTAWQFVRSNLPKYAYPGYENLEQEGSDLKKVILSLATALGSLKELLPNSFGSTAKRRRYADNIVLEKSFLRLQSPNFKKIGGGHRVREIRISDAWQEMSETADAKTAVYTQQFDYTKKIKDANGNDMTISSGVASYEPLLGGEENPFHQPVFYKKNTILQLDTYYYIEEPFCESLYPAPSVGYSQVSVRSIGAEQTESKTGKIVHEFYTAKDFPTRVDILPLAKVKYGSSKILQILASKVISNVALSQGYRIENNDMHGKPKAQSVYNLSGALVSSVEYTYKTLNPDEEFRKLDNRVKLLMPDGKVTDGVIGKDMDMFTDMRESISQNNGQRVQASGGAALLFIFPIPFFFPGLGANNENRAYYSSATIKSIQSFAVLEKVRKTENGSSITTENILWDGLTGDVLMTKTQNDFDDPVYQLTVPANWAYHGMGQSYVNEGTYLTNLTTNTLGKISSGSLLSLIHPGDEVIDLDTDKRYWIIYTQNSFSLIDRNGSLVKAAMIPRTRIVRSGYRNTLSQPLCSYVTLKNPIVGDQLNISVLTNVLSAQSMDYSEDWQVPAKVCLTCPEGYTLLADSGYCYKDTAIISGSSEACTTICDGSHRDQYTESGSYIYPLGTYSSTGTGIALKIDNNIFWDRGSLVCPTCGGEGGYGDLSAGSKTGSLTVNDPGANSSSTSQQPSTNSNIQIKYGRSGAVAKSIVKDSSATSDKTNVITKQEANTGLPNGGKPYLTKVYVDRSTDPLPDLDSLNRFSQRKSTVSVSTQSAKQSNANTGIVNNKITVSTKATSGGTNKKNITSATSSAVVKRVTSIASGCALPINDKSPFSNCGPLDRTGIWSCDSLVNDTTRYPLNKWVGFTRVVNFPAADKYYFGMAGDDKFRFYFDSYTPTISMETISELNYKRWHIFEIYVPTAGPHVIKMEGLNVNGPATIGLEIYGNTLSELSQAQNYCDLDLLFSTKDLIGSYLNPIESEDTCPTGYTLTATGSGNVCREIAPAMNYNPYLFGHKGNWRNQASYALHSQRSSPKGDPSLSGSTQIRYGGIYETFTPLWLPGSISALGKPVWAKNTASQVNKWVKATEVTAFSAKGHSIEEKDALNRYSSVVMGYLDTKPVAVATNARFSELAYDGFEDYNFHLGCSATSGCNYDHFGFRNLLGSGIVLDKAISHSGEASLRLSSSVTLTKSSSGGINNQPQSFVNSSGNYSMSAGTTWDNGFTPVVGKKYVLSMWVKDNSPRNNTIASSIKVNGTDMINNAMKWPVVEGWKRVEVSFTMPAGSGFSLQLIPSGTIWVDDIRIAPFDAQVKSYAYDPLSQRLMAEMDENNFATFYEYDEEGTLIRVKKETERGIATIKETRSSYRKN
jgi:hypothetical protein